MGHRGSVLRRLVRKPGCPGVTPASTELTFHLIGTTNNLLRNLHLLLKKQKDLDRNSSFIKICFHLNATGACGEKLLVV